MQYAVDTLSIEIGRLQKVIRKLKSQIPDEEVKYDIEAQVNEFENNVRELKRAIGVLKKEARAASSGYNSQYVDNRNTP
jgi:peptidoglycan hydrolase CwlO-like protein